MDLPVDLDARGDRVGAIYRALLEAIRTGRLAVGDRLPPSRTLARDLGASLGVGGHLTALRRTRIGPFEVEDAVTDIAPEAPLLRDADVAARVLGALTVTAEEARDLRHGKRLVGEGARVGDATPAAIDPDGRLVGIVQRRGDDIKSIMNIAEEETS